LQLDDRVVVLTDNPRYWPGHSVAASLGDGPGYPVHGVAREDGEGDRDHGHCRGEWSTADGSYVGWKGDRVNVNESPNPKHRWRVWGDPHILNPDGSKMDFSRSNGMFKMPDGTRLVMIATGPKARVHDILVFPAGLKLDGFDRSDTTDYGSSVSGRFHDNGPVH
jgi:hypothetical protein